VPLPIPARRLLDSTALPLEQTEGGRHGGGGVGSLRLKQAVAPLPARSLVRISLVALVAWVTPRPTVRSGVGVQSSLETPPAIVEGDRPWSSYRPGQPFPRWPIPGTHFLGEHSPASASIHRYNLAAERTLVLTKVLGMLSIGLLVLIVAAWLLGLLPGSVRLSQA
jgi:hypothetical protein